MKNAITGILFALTLTLSGCSEKVSEIPYLAQNEYGATQLIVDGNPYLMIGGELHNSSASTVEYMTPLFRQLKDMNLNTVLAVVAWEQFEPEENVFDYTLVDALIDNARKNELKLVLLWFGSWKNGESSYVPVWVKRDTERFFRVKNREGKNIEILSTFCSEAMNADAKAFATLMRHLAKVDSERTVIMVQPENEVGVFQEIDYNAVALERYEQDVPQKLMDYLIANTDLLKENIRQAWNENGAKKQGTWKEVFGDTIYTQEFFMAWQYATYINEIAKRGKAEYPLPMFVNTWLVQFPGQLPGKYPNGGPVAHVMDIYKAGAEHIDIVAPDIYLSDFKGICAEYKRSDNPLLIPEAYKDDGKRAFYAFARHDAICYSPFAIEDGRGNFQLIKSYEALSELRHLILQYQGSGRMTGFFKSEDETGHEVIMGDYTIRVVYEKKDAAFGLVIQTAEDEFIFSGINYQVHVSSRKAGKQGYILQAWEGGFKNEQWTATRLLNGDQSRNNTALRIPGRKYSVEELRENKDVFDTTGQVIAYDNSNRIMTAGIYKVTVYTRD